MQKIEGDLLSNASIFNVPNEQQARAVIFIHSFSKAAGATFGMLPTFVAGNAALYSWNIYCFG
jgi:hypothetical protein